MSDPPEEDPWAAGRAATADEVKAIEHHDALPAFVRLSRFLSVWAISAPVPSAGTARQPAP